MNIDDDFKLDLSKIPSHVAIIMDGNGRWATEKGLPRHLGHQEGMKRVIDVVEAANDIGITNLTLYAFSTENWKRSKIEIDTLMNLLIIFIRKELRRLMKNNIKIIALGNIEQLPSNALAEVKRAVDKTKDNSGMVLNIALNYGSRTEIIDAIKKLVKDYDDGLININNINEDEFKRYLYTNGQPDPDLIIRTSGEQRLSNFLTFQSAYSELYFTDQYWPDFNKRSFFIAINDFQNRQRRFGGV
ncbi:isoprenyl transferase [Soehngenia saccharolytica]|nr:isoprenyl transferase [Soehngenia saccharolytica]